MQWICNGDHYYDQAFSGVWGVEMQGFFFFIFEFTLKECAGILKEQRWTNLKYHILHGVNIYLDTGHV